MLDSFASASRFVDFAVTFWWQNRSVRRVGAGAHERLTKNSVQELTERWFLLFAYLRWPSLSRIQTTACHISPESFPPAIAGLLQQRLTSESARSRDSQAIAALKDSHESRGHR